MDSSHFSNDNETKKTSTMTFRINKNVLDTLKSESERRDLTLNTLINHLLKRFVEWDMYESKVGMIPIAKPIVAELFRKMSKEEISYMALSVGKDVVHDISLFMKNEANPKSFISWFETRMKHSSIEINHSSQNGYHVYVITHQLGENWSLYHKIVLELIFNEIFEKSIDVTISNATVRFQYHE